MLVVGYALSAVLGAAASLAACYLRHRLTRARLREIENYAYVQKEGPRWL